MSSFRLGLAPLGGEYEVVVVGAGPAGLTCALYLARYGIKALIVSKDIGGQMAIAPEVDDYPGLPSIQGSELAKRFREHVERYGVPIVLDEVVSVKRLEQGFVVETRSGAAYRCRAVVLAVGSRRRKLGVPGEDKFLGKGVSYCAVCDGPLYRDRVVAVVGGGNAALSSAIYLARIAKKVYLVHRRSEFRAMKVYVDAVRSNPKIELKLNRVVKELVGDERLRAVVLENLENHSTERIEVDGLFIEIGSEPPTELFKSIGIEVDEQGYAVVNKDMSTNIPGIYVVGDAAGGPHKYRFPQILTAAAEGAIAADSIRKYLLETSQHRA